MRFSAALLIGVGSGLWLPAAAAGQADAARPVIDTIIVINENVFNDEEATKNFVFRTANSLRFKTQEYVIRRELIFQQHAPYDSARIAESERNLRFLGIFREIDIDTARVDGKLAAIVTTRDGWSTKVKIGFAAASDGTLTGKAGVTEINLLGTGTLAHVAYRKDVDRDGLEARGRWRRFIGTRLTLSGEYLGLSDGNWGNWLFGAPFNTTEDRVSVIYQGFAADRRVLQFRTIDPEAPDTTFFQQRAYINRLAAAYAPIAKSSRYLRIGALAEIRREEYIFQRDTGAAIPDTVTASFALFGEFQRTRFRELRYFNGFGDEDMNISYFASLSAAIAPSVLGYERTGIGPRIVLRGAERLPEGFIKGAIAANGLFSGAGLDSGRVELSLTFGYKPGRRHATVLHISGGLLDNPPPGAEFDLGFEVPPRSFEPHSFTGNRMVAGTAEHRWYIWDNLLDLLRLGFASFIDYGGAWYSDQNARWGGNIGIGLRLGSSRSSDPTAGRIDLGYRFGDFSGSRWVLSFGPGLVF